LPILAAVEQGVEPCVVFNWCIGLEIILIPLNAEIVWLQGDAFAGPSRLGKRSLSAVAMFSWGMRAVLVGWH
jgi:hypothetical protein